MSSQGSRRLGREWQRFLLGLAIVIGTVVVIGTLAGLNRLEDFRIAMSDSFYPVGEVDPRIAVVEFSGVGFTRHDHASLITAIAEAGADVIAYDVVFEEELPGTDELVSAVRGAGNVILASIALLDGSQDPPLVTTLFGPPEDLAAAAVVLAQADTLRTPFDSVVRHIPLTTVQKDRRALPSLALAAATLAEGMTMGAVTERTVSGVNLGGVDRVVPTVERRAFEISWVLSPRLAPPDTVYSAAELLAGNVDLQGRLVFVGVADPFQDRVFTPISKEGMPGVYVHANAANTILKNVYRNDPAPWVVTAIVALLVIAVVGPGMLLPLRVVPVLALVLIAGWWLTVSWYFDKGINLDAFWPSVGVFVATAGLGVGRYVTEERERRRVSGLFKQYVPDSVADSLLASDRLAAAAEGERLDVTVLFCDLRGFTATAADLEPADVRAMLEVYYDHSTEVIQTHGGTVMQFVGDEVFAVFGAPLAMDDHAQRALDAAVDLQAAAVAINAELAERGVSVAFGIGLNTGSVVAAHVGSKVHRQYAVVGQTVNVGARLCSQAEPGGIVISKWTRDALTTVPELVSLGSVALKGVTDDPEPAKVVMGVASATSEA